MHTHLRSKFFKEWVEETAKQAYTDHQAYLVLGGILSNHESGDTVEELNLEELLNVMFLQGYEYCQFLPHEGNPSFVRLLFKRRNLY